MTYWLANLLTAILPSLSHQYERGRSTADFVKFLNEKCGTKRLPGGELSPEVCAHTIKYTSDQCHLYPLSPPPHTHTHTHTHTYSHHAGWFSGGHE